MKSKIFSIALTLSAVCALFAEPPKAAKVTRSYHRHHKHYGKGEYFQLSRGQYGYLIYFQWVKPTQNQEDQVLIGLPEPNFWSGFNRRGMFDLVINGISVFNLEPKEITVFNTPEKAGINALYNFDGVWMNIRLFMDDKTPLLHVECTKDAKTVKQVNSIMLNINVSPTVTGLKPNAYKREIITPVSVYNKYAWQKLKKEDNCFFMYDALNEGSVKKPKTNGPAFLKVDSSVWESARVHYGKASSISFQFKIKPQAEKICFSMLELKTKNTNSQFADFLHKNNLLEKKK